MDPVVLFIDDEPARMSPFATVLKNAGHKVIMATSAVEAVALAQDHRGKIRLLIVDLMLPTGTDEALDLDPRRAGLWALGEIRAIPELAKVPAVVLSAVSETRVTIENLGIAAYLPKPMSLARFVDAVNKALAASDKGGAGQ